MATEPLDLGRWFSPSDLETWRAMARQTLGGREPERLDRQVGGVIARALDVERPRGRHIGGRVGGWQVRQEVTGSRLKAASRQAERDLKLGGDAPWFRVDRGTRLGMRPDQAREADGPSGLTLLTHNDLGGLVRRIDLGRVPLAIEAGANGLAVLGALLAVADDRGVDRARLSGVVQADPLAALARDGVLPRGVDAAYDDLGAMVRSARRLPGLRVVGLSGLPAGEAGATASTELAVVLAGLTETLRRLEARGLAVADVLPKIEVLLGLDTDMVLGIAKIRAVRTLWARLAAACHVPIDVRRVFVHARMFDAVLAVRDPWSNLLRATLAGFAGAAGGADALTVLPFDAALGQSDAQARRIARNLHLLLLEESHLARVEDPAAGSYAIEQLTDALCREAWTRFQAIERRGGLLATLADGSVRDDIATEAGQRARDVARRTRGLVGVSVYPQVGAAAVERPTVDAAAHDRELHARWNAVSIALDSAQADTELQQALDALRTGTASRVTPATIAASRGVHLATIAGAVPGMAFTAPVLRPERLAAGWEALRARVEPTETTIFLANLGPVPAHKARAGFARDLFQAAGFGICDTDGFVDPDAAAQAFGVSGCAAACICGTDDAYERLVPRLVPQLQAAGARFVLVAGRWPKDPEPWREAGVADVVHVGADVLATLTTLADQLGREEP